MRGRRVLVHAAIFGLSDGLMSILGVVLDLRAHPDLVVWASVVAAVSAGASMAVGQYLSEDTDDGVPACVMLGAATAAGTVLPSLPYLWLRGGGAFAATGGICAALVLLVAAMRAHRQWRRFLLAVLLLAAVFGLTWACALAVPTGGA